MLAMLLDKASAVLSWIAGAGLTPRTGDTASST